MRLYSLDLMIEPIARRVSLALLCLLLAACAAPAATASPTRATASQVAGLSPTSTVTPAADSSTATPAPVKPRIIATLTPLPLASPTPGPSSLSPLGPWLMSSTDTLYTGPKPIINPMVMNADGSGWQRLALPANADEANPDWWMGQIAPKGGFLAFQYYSNEYTNDCVQGAPPISTLDPDLYLLYIVKLPENKVVRTIQLLGLEAQNQIQKENCSLEQDKDLVPPVYAATYNVSSLKWSPDGRYLAFSAAPDGPAADVYIYDTQTNAVRRLTHRQNNAWVDGWSPDGQSILYRDVLRMSWYHLNLEQTIGLYAVSLAGTDRLVIRNQQPTDIFSSPVWRSPVQFVTTEYICSLGPAPKCPRLVKMAGIFSL